jgi:hypothetical protein
VCCYLSHLLVCVLSEHYQGVVDTLSVEQTEVRDAFQRDVRERLCP